MSRKRKAPVASSVIRVNRADDEDSDDAEDDDTDFGSRSLSSRVSLPSKPERKLDLFIKSFKILRAGGEHEQVFCFSKSSCCLTYICFRPTLPPAKQANRNLILKAISEAQDSITKTTSYSPSKFPSATHLKREHTLQAFLFHCHHDTNE